MKFKISSSLKNIIGKDLITDDFVAIFELVKNSFDAFADTVEIYFGKNEICISDNGKGMSEDDLRNKWLFVAYSAKADDTEDVEDYRELLKKNRNKYSGNKGVGRFSCDRLGSLLTIETKTKKEEQVNQLIIDWNKFEENQHNKFNEIDISFSKKNGFDFNPEQNLSIKETGTKLTITGIRDKNSWNRKKILRLKASLAKLIDPFGIMDKFSIIITAPSEAEEDNNDKGFDENSPYTDIVNGPIKNNIFDKLSQKTTRIKTYLSDDSTYIFTELVDRGECVYKIKEKNKYKNLSSCNISIEIYYMNTIAKNNFTRTVGVHSTQFGSIFVFNNGFRVYPIGEPDDDSLGLNTRKAQGYSRFLGSREVLGLIDVYGDKNKFKEASSRDKGLIKTDASEELITFFYDKGLKRLESYVTNVSWPDKLDAESENLSRILTDQGKSKVVNVLTRLVSGKDIELLEYSETLIDTINIRNNKFENVIKDLQFLSQKINSSILQSKVDSALSQFKQLKRAEEQSRIDADNERKLRIQAEFAANDERHQKEEIKLNLEKNQKNLQIIAAELKEEKKRTLFLTKVSSVDLDTIRNFHHQIGIYSSSINHLIQLQLDNINHGNNLTTDDIKSLLESVSFKNQQILTISRIATLADYRVSAEEVEDDLILFCKQYLENIVKNYHLDIDMVWNADNNPWIVKFMPLELMIVIDNLVHNASKPNMGCTNILFNSYISEKNRLTIEITDDGYGFEEYLKNDINRIFEMGVTTTNGSGLGLYHVKQVIDNMGGRIDADLTYSEGAKFIIRFAK